MVRLYSVKQEEGAAFDKKCKDCGAIGHFANSKACRKKGVKVEMVK